MEDTSAGDTTSGKVVDMAEGGTMDVVTAARSEGFTREDLEWRLPGIPGCKHELLGGMYVITSDSRPLTVRDLDRLADVPGATRELLDGSIVMVPAPNVRHQGFVLRLTILLNGAVTPDFRVRTAPLDVWLTDEIVIQPDVLVVQRPLVTDAGIEGPPDLAVEVLSPTTTTRDKVVKRALLEEAGCPSYWIVDPAPVPTLTVLELMDGKYAEIAHVSGSESWTATRPFPVTVVPDELVDD